MTSVTLLPTAAAVPVVNPRNPGRRNKSVASLHKARLERSSAAAGIASPAIHGVTVATVTIDGGEMTHRQVFLANPADAFNMLANLYILMGEVIQHMHRDGTGGAQ